MMFFSKCYDKIENITCSLDTVIEEKMEEEPENFLPEFFRLDDDDDLDYQEYDPVYEDEDEILDNIRSAYAMKNIQHQPSMHHPSESMTASLPHKKLTRKRLKNPSSWKVNMTKPAVNEGRAYISLSTKKRYQQKL